MSDYSLEIISHHTNFKNKNLRKYHVDGIDTIGAYGDEPFEIVFKNNTYNKAQVKLSVDGTDILTGDLATTESTPNMWVVNAYGTLSVKAWPETNNGGAQLVFSSGKNSVAINTHGDMSNRGIIAAAVFTEGHVEPVKAYQAVQQHNHYYYHYPYGYYNPYFVYPYTYAGSIGYNGIIGGVNSSGTYTANQNFGVSDFGTAINCSYNASTESAAIAQNSSVESLVAVGAGQYVEQNITYSTGLVKPLFNQALRIRYLWWDELVAKLRENNAPLPHASGFPGNVKQTNINLGSTPRIGAPQREFVAIQQSYSRV